MIRKPNPRYFVTSKLADEDVQDLEDLFYFNPNQWKLKESVEAAVRQYGAPIIEKSDGKLRLSLTRIEQGQTLYLYEAGPKSILAGVVVYIRDGRRLKVLFWGLKPKYTVQYTPNQYLLIEIVNALRKVGKSIVGIELICYRFGSREYSLRV